MNVSLDLSSMRDSSFRNGDSWLDGEETLKACKIYGRTREQKLLINTFQSLAQSNDKQRKVIMIHGCAGTGKTALVERFRDVLCKTNQIHFCAGKYFQNSSVHEPYSAITSAFSDLCDLVSQQADEFDPERKLQTTKRILGGEAEDVLQKFVLNFSPFSEPSKMYDLLTNPSNLEALYEFEVACKTFLKAISSWHQPVVVFLDDIQWMDTGSKHLIEIFLNDFELKNVLFVFAYRDEENDVVTKALANIDRNDFVDVQLDNMKSHEIIDFISEVKKMPVTDELIHLGKLIQKRTEGNTLHVIQFIDAIEQEKLLQYDSKSGSWVYDVEKIQREMMASDTLSDQLLLRIQLLTQDEQETLKIASLLGYEFEAKHIFQVSKVLYKDRNQEHDKIISSTISFSLGKAVELGILERIQNGRSFHFSHINLQTKLLSMLSASETQRLHHLIGEMYLAASCHDNVYHAVIHLNLTLDSPRFDPGFKHRLASLNLMASQYCKDRSAFDVSASLLRKGLSLLEGEEKWSSTFDLAFVMTEELARMELKIGNLDACKVLTSETLRRATSRNMKINSLLIDVECQMVGNEFTSVINTVFNALKILGIRMPWKVSASHILSKFLSVRLKLSGKTNAYILQLPLMRDRAKVAATRILIDLSLYCAMQDKADLSGAFAGLYAVELTLLHGLSSHSATAIVLYGSTELLFCKKHDCAYRFGRLALDMIDRVQCRDTECAVVSLWVNSLGHWENPIRDLQAVIRDAVETGFHSYDTLYTSLAIVNSFGMMIFLGDNLQELEGFMRNTYNRLVNVSQGAMLLCTQPAFQFVLNHRSKASHHSELIVLTGEIMDEPEYFRMAVEAKHPSLMVAAWTYKGVLAFNFGFTELAIEIFQKLENIGGGFRASYESLALSLYASLSYYEEYRRTGRRTYLRIARKWQRKLEQAASRGNPNTTFVTLLRAEGLAARKSVSSKVVRAAFDLAIVATAKHKYTHYEGMCNQRAAFYMASREKYDAADRYFERSIALHEEWGAPNMVDWLQQKRSGNARFKDLSEEALWHGVDIVGKQTYINVESGED